MVLSSYEVKTFASELQRAGIENISLDLNGNLTLVCTFGAGHGLAVAALAGLQQRLKLFGSTADKRQFLNMVVSGLHWPLESAAMH